jgi:hypothetical protein
MLRTSPYSFEFSPLWWRIVAVSDHSGVVFLQAGWGLRLLEGVCLVDTAFAKPYDFPGKI